MKDEVIRQSNPKLPGVQRRSRTNMATAASYGHCSTTRVSSGEGDICSLNPSKATDPTMSQLESEAVIWPAQT